MVNSSLLTFMGFQDKCLKSVTPGDIHYFTDKDELTLMLSNFNKIEISIDEGTWINSGEKQFYSNFIVIAKKQ